MFSLFNNDYQLFFFFLLSLVFINQIALGCLNLGSQVLQGMASSAPSSLLSAMGVWAM